MSSFVVQEHVADRAGHHFDLRLNDGQVLQSWVLRYIPHSKGEKRLAIRMPEHPKEYEDFEGQIDEGYGKGSVSIWDQGEYDVVKASPGFYEVFLSGDKLVGHYDLKYWKDDKWLIWKK